MVFRHSFVLRIANLKMALHSRANVDSSAKTAKFWKCSACGANKCWASTTHCYCCGAKRPGQKRKGKNSKTAKPSTVTDSDDSQTEAKESSNLSELRRQLQTLKKWSESTDIYAKSIEDLETKIEAEVASKEASTPTFFTEMTVSRKVKADERKLESSKERVAKLQEQQQELAEKIATENKKMESIQARLEQHRERLTRLHSTPATVGKGIEATFLHLQNAFNAIAPADEAETASLGTEVDNAFVTLISNALEAAKKAKELVDKNEKAAAKAEPQQTPMEVDGLEVKAGQTAEQIAESLESHGVQASTAKRQAATLAGIAADLAESETICIKRLKT